MTKELKRKVNTIIGKKHSEISL